jgi:glycosyltransferase involved in cell wall biosynthesis
MNPLKICVIATNHSALDSRIFGLQATSLARAGYDVTILALHPRAEIVDGIRIVPIADTLTRSGRVRSLPKVLRMALHERADAYHIHDIELLPVGVLLKWFSNARVIYDVHEDFPRIAHSRAWIPRILREPVSLLINLYEKGLARALDAVIVTTEAIGENFGRSRTTPVRNFPPLDLLNYHAKNRRERGDEPAVLLYTGRITRARGMNQLIEAVEHIARDRNVKLKVIGASKELDLKEILKSREDLIELIDWLPPDELYRHIEGADIGLILFLPEPGHLTTLPRKLFEYMGIGIPVVTSNFPLYREIVDRFEAGLTVDPTDPDAVALAIQRILENPDLARDMGERGRQAVADHFNWEGESGTLLELYRELLH